MKRKLIVLFVCGLFASVAFAHSDEKHVIGTVTQVSQESVTVRTSPNEVVEVLFGPETKFTKGNATAGPGDVHVGDRVVIHAKPRKDGKLVARTVQIGAAKIPAQSL